MSVPVTIGTVAEPNNKLLKNMTSPTVYNCNFKSEVSTRDPVLTLAANLADIEGKNYMRMLDKYYFITDITSVRNGLVQITGHIDVLNTYRDAILAGKGYVQRRNDGHKYVPDPMQIQDIRRDVQYVAFDKGFTNQAFILAVAGNPESVSNGGA